MDALPRKKIKIQYFLIDLQLLSYIYDINK
jgi:hypothetical protein